MDETSAADPMPLLKNVDLFQPVPEDELQAISGHLRLRTFEAGQTIVVEGEPGDSCYLIASGEAGVVSRDLVGQEVTLAVFGPGILFGEIALVRHGPRTATVKAISDVRTLVLRRDDFEHLEAACPGFSARLRRHVELLELDGFLRKASPFARLPKEAVRTLAQQLAPVDVSSGETIIREGEQGDRFYLVRRGRLEVLKGNRRLQIFEAGDYFGEVALLADTPRTATVRALEDCELLALGRAEFQAVVGEHETMRGLFGEAIHLRVGKALIQAVTAVDPRTTLAPLLKGTRHGYWWKVAFFGLALFGMLSLVAARTEVRAIAYAATVAGSFVVPVAFVCYLAESNILAHRLSTILITFLAGAALGLPSAIQIENFAFQYLGGASASVATGVIEETVKLLGIVWLLRRASSRFSMDGAIFGAAAGMGFAAFETLMYGLDRIDVLARLLSTLWMRALLSPFGHGTWTAIVCAAIWAAKGSGPVQMNRRLATAWMLAVGLHALWDWHLLPGNFYLIWLIVIGAVGVAILASVVEGAQKEEAGAVLALNPELAEVGKQATRLTRVACHSCGQVAPPGAHYCARCGAALRRESRVETADW